MAASSAERTQRYEKYCEEHINEKHTWSSIHHPQTLGKLTHFYKNSQIPKTNNIIEQHFANTNPKVVKCTFKPPSSLENYLFAIAAYKNKDLSLKT